MRIGSFTGANDTSRCSPVSSKAVIRPTQEESMRRGSVRALFAVALRLGHWLGEATFAELVALCQSLPGPASSQLGIAIGMLRAGLRGGVAAWLGFTMPSALALVLFAELVGARTSPMRAGCTASSSLRPPWSRRRSW